MDPNKLDKTWPAINCCRLYENDKFMGRQLDLCYDENNMFDTKSFNLEAGDFEWWDNKMSSWKCGAKTAVNFCTRANRENCFTDHHYGESAGGHAESQDTGIDNSLTLLTLTPYDPDETQAITVFRETRCHGRSSVLWSDQSYSDTKEQITIEDDIQSIMVPEGEWDVVLYKLTDFRAKNWSKDGKSYEVSHNTGEIDKLDDRNDCIDVPANIRG